MAIVAIACLCALPVSAQITFTERTVEAGFGDDVYTTNSNHGLGVLWIDVDNDGWVDLFAPNGWQSDPHLYLNQGDGTFAKRDDLLPAMVQDEQTHASYADYDNDGDPDIYVLAADEDLRGDCNCNDADGPPNLLLKNLFVENGNQIIDGQPLFEDVAAAAGVEGLANPAFGDDPARRSLSGGWLDYDRDGCVDLYVAQWAIRHGGEMSNQDLLYRNNCDGTFTDATASVGLPDGTVTDDLRPSLAFIAGHLDGDLWPDMYVENVSERSDPLPEGEDATCDPECPDRWFDYLWQNNGDGTFTDIIRNSPGMGNDTGAGMGMDIADIDHDGDWEIYISDVLATFHDKLPLGNPLYVSNGDGTWSDNVAVEAGVEGRFSWAVNFFDADQDTWEDLYVSVMGTDPQDLMYRNNQDGTFTDVAVAAGFNLELDGRGAATADYDLDGDLDLAVVEKDSTIKLYRNDTVGGNYLKIDLQATQSNRSAIGTLVKVLVDGQTLLRQVKGGSSAHSQDDLTVHYGLGPATTIDRVRIWWPSGLVDSYGNLSPNTTLVATEGETTGPKVTRVEPRTLSQGTSLQLTLRGLNLVDGGTATVGPEERGVTIDGVTWVDSQTALLDVTVAADAFVGPRSVTWTNPDGRSNTRAPAVRVVP